MDNGDGEQVLGVRLTAQLKANTRKTRKLYLMTSSFSGKFIKKTVNMLDSRVFYID
jgi:hypothetical protein